MKWQCHWCLPARPAIRIRIRIRICCQCCLLRTNAARRPSGGGWEWRDAFWMKLLDIVLIAVTVLVVAVRGQGGTTATAARGPMRDG